MDLRRVDLNLLVALDALLAERSVTRAAERLHVGQSAMSSTLGRLRRLLDDPVLIRQGHVMTPTPLARSLEQPLRAALTGVEQLLDRATRFDPATAERRFDVIASDYVSLVFLKPLMAELALEAPGVRLRLQTSGADHRIEPLRWGDADLAIVPREHFPEYSEYRHAYLFDDRFVCVVDAANAAIGDDLTRAEFEAMPYLATECGRPIAPLEAELDALGVRRNHELSAPMGLVPSMIRDSRMIAVVHERLIAATGVQGAVRALTPPFAIAPITELLLWSERADADAGHRWLRERIVRFAQEEAQTAIATSTAAPSATR